MGVCSGSHVNNDESSTVFCLEKPMSPSSGVSETQVGFSGVLDKMQLNVHKMHFIGFFLFFSIL